MILSDLKTILINSAKTHYSDRIIFPEYPVFKQANIIRAGGQDLTDMATFIDGKRADIDVIETDINALADVSIWEDFTTGSDANMASFVSGKCPNLTADEQKLAVAVAIQNAQTREVPEA